MAAAPLVAHSLAEAYLYLMASACEACGRGPLKGGPARPVAAPDNNGFIVAIGAACGSCGAARDLLFRLPGAPDAKPPASGAVVNPTDDPSRIIDIAQWLTLWRVITEAAARESDKVQARHLGLEAAQCLEEALKFYDDDNDLPPAEALFHDASRRRLQEHPEQFSRQRLLELRAKLPTTAAMRASVERPGAPKRRRWWSPKRTP